MQNYIHAFQVSTTSTCIFNDSSAAFITFYRLLARLWWIKYKQDCLQQPAGADDCVETIRVQFLGIQQQHASLSAKKKSSHPQPVRMKWDIAVREAAFYEVHRLTRFHKRGHFDMTHVIV
ncbi:hypothetical protein CAPTEDRAFT_199641 [Capitella teleta]|uniref:Uncharacterized protein n=1 Tax=Capitella teleta TaxID=283909 RepID=R7UFU1_CAPTE|nr:hypothetical protein CAPTEDRAFT_199641 [Capitella teleta]|eukprot:ELU02668.1 hypothetical protein CAPTEDRAFT_199641 [Capitella teleta]